MTTAMNEKQKALADLRRLSGGRFNGNSHPLSRARDPSTSHMAEEEYKKSGRHETHVQQILDRLKLCPAGAAELAGISLKYTGRISDLRKLGHDIEYDTKLKLYTLRSVEGQQEFNF